MEKSTMLFMGKSPFSSSQTLKVYQAGSLKCWGCLKNVGCDTWASVDMQFTYIASGKWWFNGGLMG